MPVFRAWSEEYRRIFGDRGVLLIFMGAAVLYSFFYPMPYRPEVLRDVAVAVVDRDNSQMSRRLVRMLDANEYAVVVSRPRDFAEARRQFDDRTVHGILVIPEHLERDVKRGKSVGVAAYIDTGTLLHYRQLRTGMTQAIQTLSAGIEVKGLRARGYTGERAMEARDPVEYVSVPLFNRAGGYSAYIVPAVFILILQQTLLVGIGMLAGTRRDRTDYDASAGPVARVLGKTGAYVSIYTVNLLYYLAVLKFVYGYSFRTPPLVLLAFLEPFLLAVALLGLALAPVFRNRETPMALLIFSSLPMLFLAGFAWPREALPEWLRVVSYVVPSTAGIDGFLRLSRMGAGLRDVLPYWKALWLLVAALLPLACLSERFCGRRRG